MNSTSIDEAIESTITHRTLLSEKQVKYITDTIIELYSTEPNIVTASSPAIVCGSINGHFDDLVQILMKYSYKQYNYVFLGSYVNRGHYSVEVIQLLFLLKIRYPQSICLLRGYFEHSQISSIYGFMDEVKAKYKNTLPYTCYNDAFQYLPICAVLDNKYLCIHSGLSPFIKYLDQINDIYRVVDPNGDIYMDLLTTYPDADASGWAIVSGRGLFYMFGEKIVKFFNKLNNIEKIFRTKQLEMEGYKAMFNDTIYSIWSCGNYCNRCGNLGAVVKVENAQVEGVILPNANDKKPGIPYSEYFV